MGKRATVGLLSNYVFAGYRFLYLYTTEELKTLKIVEALARETETKKVYTYDTVRGLVCASDKRLRYLSREDRADIYRVLEFISESLEGKAIVVFKDIYSLIDTDHRFVRAFKNCIEDILSKGLPITIIALSPVLHLPPELEKEAVVVDILLPTRDEIKQMLEDFLLEQNFGAVSDTMKSKIIDALNGLTEQEVRNIMRLCAQNGEFDEEDINLIIEQKKQIVRKGGVLEFIKTEENIGDIGGLNNLKKWLKRKKKIFDNLQKARDFSVDIPKGVLLFGMPGCGKSLSAKVTANYFEMPLLRLDMGMIMGPYVGQSEENMRKAIKLAEAIAPSILWIDEIEKAFAGVINSGGGGGGAEVSARIFGTILTWMQEKKKPVFVIATANSITGMPPEFLRKGRFDEIFFVNFPKKEEAEDILRVHLKKRQKESWYKDMSPVIDRMQAKRFSGADIEAVVKEVVEMAFVDERTDIEADDFIKVLDSLKPLSETMKDEIAEMEKRAKQYGFNPAS